MSYLLEALGRGLLGQLLDAFEAQLPGSDADTTDDLRRRRGVSPQSADLAVRLGIACLRDLRLAEAREAFTAARELGTSPLKGVLGLACVADELGELDEAIRQLGIAQAHDPDDPATAFAIGFCQERAGRIDAATAAYTAAQQLCPELRNTHERLAAIALKRGDLATAIAQYRQLAEMEPDDLDVRLTLGALELQRGDAGAGIEEFQRALLIEPEPRDDAGAEAAEDEDELRAAVSTISALTRKYPGVADFHVHLGDLYVRLGEDGDALRAYQSALEIQPGYLEATVKLGTQHLRQGRYIEAAQTFNRAVELNDRLMTAFVGLGVAQHQQGLAEEARATFELAASLEPNSNLLFAEAARLHARSERGEALCDSTIVQDENAGRALIEDSIRRHQQALIFSPNYADLHYRHGLLLRQVGRLDEAIEAFERAVAINPHYVKAQIKLGVCLRQRGRWDEAVTAFTRALQTDQASVDIHYQLGLLFAQRNRFDLAAEHFEAAVAGNRNNVAFRQNLALSLQIIGLLDRAGAMWRSICELSRETRIAIRERATLVSCAQ